MRRSRLMPLGTCGKITGVCGLLSVVCALICVVLYEDVHSWVRYQLTQETIFRNDSLFFEAWKDPPITPKTKVFVFNVTNHEQVLAGTASQFEVRELGPFVYTARTIKRVIAWGHGGATLTFQSKTTYHYVADESAYPDDTSTFVIVPNILMMTGMLKTEVRPQPAFVKQNIVWPILTSAGFGTPFLNLSVASFVWGYEDELGCLDSDPVGQHEESPFAFDDDFLDPGPRVTPPKRNYRQPDGRCVFGTLVGRNDSWEAPITIETGLTGLGSKGRVVEADGRSSFRAWRPDSSCDRITGNFEPSALPPQAGDSFNLLLGIMCRSIRMEHVANVSYGQIQSHRYVPYNHSFNFTSDSCFQPLGDELRLAPGAMRVATCTEGAPLLVSFPHFHGGSDWYLNQVHGLTPAQAHLHLPYIDLEPTLGAPLGIQIRFQVSLLLESDPNFPPLAKLVRNQLLLPVFWVQEGYHSPLQKELNLVAFGLHLPNYVALGLPVVFVVTALVMCGLAVLCSTTGKTAINSSRGREYDLVLATIKCSPSECKPLTML